MTPLVILACIAGIILWASLLASVVDYIGRRSR